MPTQVLSMKLITGNGNRCKFAKICLEKTREITARELILW